MRVVVDTNVLISALLFNGKSRTAYDYCVENADLFASSFLISELEEKLSTKFLIEQSVLGRILESLELLFNIVEPGTPLPKVCRDADDNYILQLCESVNADYLISGDKDLLVLKQYKQTTIVNPNEFLKLA